MSKESEAIARIQKGLKCDEETARQIYLDDCAIDKGEKRDFDLSREQLEVARKYAHAGTRKAPTVYKFDKKERPKDAKKEQIIAEIVDFLREKASFEAENIEIVNSAKLITFKVGEQSYKLDLIATRKPKN